jgi:radical SAM/Cys-rich protein
MEAVIEYASRARFATIDITGGAPELVPGIDKFLVRLAPLADQLMFRTNLVALEREPGASLLPLFQELRIRLVASLPSTSRSQADAQRGAGVWERSCGVLRQLNELGFGQSGSGLELDLAVNPGGAFLAADQAQTEKRYHRELAQLGIEFTRLFTFTNVILGRYREWLIRSGNLTDYRQMLIDRFNPQALCGVMCRSLISVGWDGILYDCDFNQALGLAHGEHRHHVSEMESRPSAGSAIATGDHCYACTAGAGFT